jgi:hypothetical protein
MNPHFPSALGPMSIQYFMNPVESGLWTKPKDCSWVLIYLVGGGGGGAGGKIAASSINGGGGGGAGSVYVILLPAVFAPNVLRFKLGAGGAGGASNASGTAGGFTYLLDGEEDINNIAYAYRGGAGNVDGTGGTSFIQTPAGLYANLYLWKSYAGGAGGAGSAIANGTDIISNGIICGGAGGGPGDTTTYGGGNVYPVDTTANGCGIFPNAFYGGNRLLAGSIADSAPFSVIGETIRFYGGAGGGGTVSGAGTAGGNGGPGCGGGGGGGAVTGQTAGVGGSGGNGFAIVVTW